MDEVKQNQNLSIINAKVEDDLLINFFCDLIKNDQIDFIREMESFNIFDKNIDELSDEDKFSNVDKQKLINIFEELLIDDKQNDEKARVFKKQKIYFQKLWPHFVRNAIKFLRHKDYRDKGTLKFDFGVERLTKYFKEFSKFEEILYGIDEYYRDHSLHVFRVYLLGEYIVREFLNGYDNVDIMNRPINISKVQNSEKEAIWCIIALCHDLGYPLEKLNELNKKLIKILEYFGTSNFSPLRYSLPLEGIILDKFILKLISSRITNELKTHMQSKFYTKYSNAYEKLDHGVMSCILLMKNLVYFKESDYESFFEEGFTLINDESKKTKRILEDARQFLIRREILRSIASHDNEDIYHIKMNNFPFLLIICDEIQEWARPASTRRLYYPLDDKNKEIIEIIDFNNNNIEISIIVNLFGNDFKEYSTKKFRRFIRLLRSAVDSETRKFNFKMTIKNKENYSFIFKYDNPIEFYEDDKNKDKSYNEPSCESFNPEGKKDEEFSIKNIIRF
ncbi:MAG: hypothetical protein ACFFDN_11560 [Candidatus Hodarchaeota archaeon]